VNLGDPNWNMIDHLKSWAKTMKRDVLALYFAGRDPRVSWYVKLLATATAAYALSPIETANREIRLIFPSRLFILGYIVKLK
jgi:uncharacterized membrane protein YkvA (DUF1232 family)